MKKRISLIIVITLISFSKNIFAADCSDLNGHWKGQLGEIYVESMLDVQGVSKLTLQTPRSFKAINGIRMQCQIKDGMPNFWFHFRENNDRGTGWYFELEAQAELNQANELKVNLFQYRYKSGPSGSGTGILHH